MVDELSWLLSITGWSILWGGFSGLAYIGFEPYARRWWPHTLVSWTRVLAGRVRDPLVGRHVLIGSFLGILSAALALIDQEVSAGSPPPLGLQLTLDALQSSWAFGSLVVFTTLNAVVTSLYALALLVLFRLILRSTWAASIALITLVVPVFATGTAPHNIAASVLLTVLGLVTLFRVGIVAHMALLVVMVFLTWFPLTLDRDAWYFGQSLIVLLLISAVATYGFLVALGERPAFGDMEGR